MPDGFAMTATSFEATAEAIGRGAGGIGDLAEALCLGSTG
jgi:hypothetical protein